jgi:hypothetical protein
LENFLFLFCTAVLLFAIFSTYIHLFQFCCSPLFQGKYFIKAFKEYSVLNKFCDLFYRTVTLSDKVFIFLSSLNTYFTMDILKTWSDVLRLVRLIVNSNFHTGASLFPEILPKLDHLVSFTLLCFPLNNDFCASKVQKLLAGNECIPLFWVLAEVMVIPGVLQHRRGLCIFIIFS